MRNQQNQPPPNLENMTPSEAENYGIRYEINRIDQNIEDLQLHIKSEIERITNSLNSQGLKIESVRQSTSSMSNEVKKKDKQLHTITSMERSDMSKSVIKERRQTEEDSEEEDDEGEDR